MSTEHRDLLIASAVMAAVVLASNILVQYPIAFGGLGEYLTWGAFSYPFAFLVTDLANRRFGPAGARKVVYAGFLAAVLLSAYLATPRIAVASGTAFLVAQLLDIGIFSSLRRQAWWVPPFVSSVIASAVDTAIFFSLAFYCGVVPGTGVTIADALAATGILDSCMVMPWTSLAVTDYAVKVALAVIAIGPYGALRQAIRPAERARA
jgi:uncharacterized PurR-regulated membrane protein YhhQ (DUF165 family)